MKIEPLSLERRLVLSGLGNRRYCAWLVRQGRVAVNGRIARDSKKRIPIDAQVHCDGTLCPSPSFQTWLLHKPRGHICQTGESAPTALSLVPDGLGLALVGRLDLDSEGLILATNDGELSHRLTHPDYHIPKIYHVRTRQAITERQLATLCSGLPLEGVPTRPLQGRRLKKPVAGTWLELILTEGRKRQIRRLCEIVGLDIVQLKRVALGPLELGNLPPGSARQLYSDELHALRESAQI